MAKEVPKRPKQSVKPAKSASRTEKHTHASKKAPKSPPAILNPERLFPIVGVGASAGGLEAFTALLKHLPSDTGMAFVLIQHLDRKQPSHLTDLLSKATRMPVLEVNASTPLKPDHVYVIG